MARSDPDEFSNFQPEKSKKGKTYQIDSGDVLGALEHVDEAFSDNLSLKELTIKGTSSDEDAIIAAGRKRKRFLAGTTTDFYMLHYFFITIALALCVKGLFDLILYHRDTFVIYFVLATLALILPVMVKNLNITKYVIITPEALMIGKGDNVRSIGWQEIVEIKEIRKNKKHFRWTILTDNLGRHITFSSLLFPGFDLFMSLLRVALRFYEEKSKETDTAEEKKN